MLDGIAEGESVEVSFNLRGREWTSPQNEVKYFNTLDAWRIEVVNGQSDKPSATKKSKKSSNDNEEEDDLPF